jgi:spermidine/putrescine transport system ATP-binding protein
MSHTLIEQVGDGNTIYDLPETSFVASFVGENNLFEGTVSAMTDGYAVVDTPSGTHRARAVKRHGEVQLKVGDAAHVFIRPESLKFTNGESLDNQVDAKVTQREFEGNFWQVFFDVEGSDQRIKLSTVNDGSEIKQQIGDQVKLGFSADTAIAIPAGKLASDQ